MDGETAGETRQPQVFPVGQLTRAVRQLLEDRVGRVWVSGEVSNLFEARTGHRYFTLKDDVGQLRAVLFRGASRNVAFEIEEGMEVRVYAELSVYETRGDLQLIVRAMEPSGEGAARWALEQLRKRLLAEGLFDEARKRPLPRFPRGVAIVTSTEGAALRDVVAVARRRFSGIAMRVLPTRVQGERSAEEIARALGEASEVPGVDVVLLVRGGGSREDLASFNTEVVVRAVVACSRPVVTGVGHEVDFTLVDAASDLRASTPSSAAALVFPEREALRERVEVQRRRLVSALATHFEDARTGFVQVREALFMLAPGAQLEARRSRLQVVWQALNGVVREGQQRNRHLLAECGARLDALSPLSVLDRGYALVRKSGDGEIVRRPQQIQRGERLSIRVAKAQIEATTDRVDPLE